MEDNIEIVYREDADSFSHSPHIHSEYEILLFLDDGSEFFCRTTLYPIHSGSLFVLDGNMIHHCVSQAKAYRRYILHVSRDVLQQFSTAHSDLLLAFEQLNFCYELSKEDYDLLVSLFDQCIAKKERIYCDDILLMSLKINLLATICQKIHAMSPTSMELPENDDPSSRVVMEIINYIQNNLTEELSLDILSQQLYFSKYYMCKIFKTLTGFTIWRYVSYCRVLKACGYLRSGYSIQDAAKLSGFKDYANFTRIFTKYVGFSPAKYKAQHLQRFNIPPD